MSDIHIDDFYKDVGLIFLRLYNSFPRPTVLYVDDIAGPDSPDEFGLHSERFLAGFSAMSWLGEHDYLLYETAIKQEALDQAVLSRRSFLLLCSRSELDFGEAADENYSAGQDVPPSVMEHSKTNIIQLRRALRSGSSIIIRQCVHYLLSQDSQ